MVIGSTLRTGRQHRRRWLLLGCVIVLGVALGGYLFASWSVWNTLAAVSGACHEVDAADTPQSFHVYGLDDAIAAQYAMPAPRDVTFRSATRRSRTSCSARGGSPAGRQPAPR